MTTSRISPERRSPAPMSPTAYADCSPPIPSCSLLPIIERARPLLGTIVAVRVHGVAPRRAQHGIEQAFCALAEIHRLMSFQDAASDVSRLNREAALAAVTVHTHTYRVLAWAARIAQ